MTLILPSVYGHYAYASVTSATAASQASSGWIVFCRLSAEAGCTCARQIGFSTSFLAFLQDLYTARRCVIIDNVVAAAMCPNRSVVAGCSLADVMMFLLMLAVDTCIAQSAPEALF